jgi:hypothetical protein
LSANPGVLRENQLRFRRRRLFLPETIFFRLFGFEVDFSCIRRAKNLGEIRGELYLKDDPYV